MAADWSALGGVYYEQRELYSLAWGIDVDASRVACAPFGGPVAVMRDDRKILKNAAGQARKQRRLRCSAVELADDTRAPVLLRLTAALRHGANLQLCGRRTRQVPVGPFRAPGRLQLDRGRGTHARAACSLRGTGTRQWHTLTQTLWPFVCTCQVLLCVADDGGVYPYTVDGELLPWQMSLGAECAAQGVADARVWPTGLVALTHSAQLFAVRPAALTRRRQ